MTKLLYELDDIHPSQLKASVVTDLISQLGGEGESRYMPQQDRQLLGHIVDRAATNTAAMHTSLQALLASIDSYWWPLKFQSFDPELALSEVMMFAFIELSDQSKVGSHRRDPLACVRTNATNRAVSSLRTQQRQTYRSDPLPTTALERRGDAEMLVDELRETLRFMTSDISRESGQSSRCAASFVLHRGFGLSFQDLAHSSSQSKATHHRRSQQVENALREKYCPV